MLTPRQLFLQHLAQTTDFPLLIEIERAEGVYMYGPKGEKYLDLISGISVSNVGHRHPRVVQAVKDQADRYMHLMVYGEFVQGPQTRLAQRLVQHLPSPLDNVYFTNSGSESIEGAMKLAKRFTRRTDFVSCVNAYHGSSQGALSVSGSEWFKRAYRPLLPGIRQIRFNEPEDLRWITERTAGILVETIQGEAGVRIPDEAYLQALRASCNQTGALLILDEIQAGFGRTGTLFAFEQYGIVPDILVCAKGMGGGMPIGAFIAPQAIMAVLKENPMLGHITTFGGHPISCAASLATLEVILENDLLPSIRAKEALFKELLVHPAIRGIRSRGLLMAVEFESFSVLKPVIDRAIEQGVLTDWFLYCDHAMRIAPPLTITETEIREACQIILSSI